MLEINRQALAKNKTENVQSLYERYSGMLLGYIFEVVKDRSQAEECLVQLFCELSKQFNEKEWTGSGNWCQLQRLARNKLTAFTDTFKDSHPPVASGLVMQNSNDNYLQQLTTVQRQVFYDVYYHGKPVERISMELNETEGSIRKILKEAFAIMRKSGEN